MWDIDKIDSDVKSMLSDYRYNHSVMVARVAKELASIYNLDTDKAYVAGLLHDIAKEFTDEENEYYVNKYNIDKKYLSDNLKPVLHGIVGSYYVKEKYNMDDEVCNSIKYHSLGNIDMTLFEKIILLSDKLGRDNYSEELLNLAKVDIDKAMINYFDWLKGRFDAKGKSFEPETILMLQKLKKVI